MSSFAGKGSVRSISAEELTLWLQAKLPELEKIRNEEKMSWRHDIFRDGPPKSRARLKYQQWGLRLTAEQQEVIPKYLLKLYCPSDMKLFSYVMDVLVPEAIVSLLMEIHQISPTEAEELMTTMPEEPVIDVHVSPSDAAELSLTMSRSKKVAGYFVELSDNMLSKAEALMDLNSDDDVVEEREAGHKHTPVSADVGDPEKGPTPFGRRECKQRQPHVIESVCREKGHPRKPSTTVSELIQRGKDIQKRMKRKAQTNAGPDEPRHKLKKEEDAYVTMSVCVMRRNRKMAYYPMRETYKEVSVKRQVCYTDLAEQAADALGFEDNQTGKELALFRVSGVLIPEGSQKAPIWTLDKWLRSLHKAPTAIKLGVGLIPRKQHNIPSDSKSGQDSHLTTTISVKVMYAREDEADSEVREETRSHLCTLDSNEPPEEYGYKVARIIRGSEDILFPDPLYSHKFKVLGADEDVFAVEHQSADVVTVKSFKDPAILYCVASIHDDKTVYQWVRMGYSRVYPNAPVIYVTEEGVYRCSVTRENDVSASKAIRVEMIPDDSERFSKDEIYAGIDDPSENRSALPIATETPKPQTPAFEYQGGVMQFSKNQLEAASQNFQSVIGKGAYGKVYHGNVHGCAPIAIKVLSQEGENAITCGIPTEGPTSAKKQMETEIVALSRFRHPNLVALMGFCLSPPALVYEYLANGSLYDNLHDLKGKDALSWQQRATILRDACLGMVYLHTADPPLLHQDIKSMNILVDGKFHAKLGDFGFAVELPRVSCGRTMFTANFCARSEGYYAPEISTGKYSDRSDVYSYGIVVLETFTGQKAFVSSRDDSKLIDHLADDLKDIKTFRKIADPMVCPVPDDMSSIMWDITVRCTIRHSKRPSSSEVLDIWKEM